MQVTLVPEPKGAKAPKSLTPHKPVTRSQTATAQYHGSGDEVAFAGMPASAKKSSRRKSINGKAE